MGMQGERPNIILINCDDMGYGDLSCYGSTVNRTPNIDRLAAEGVRCTSWYAPSPVCSPSRASLMTGCYPPRVGFGDLEGNCVLFPGHHLGLNPAEKTVAQVLKEDGYATMMVGKWHCGDQPEFLPRRFGFDQYYGLPYSNDMGRQSPSRKDRKTPLGNDYNPLPLIADDEVIEEQPDQCSITERYTEKAISFIREHQDGPFFLYFAHMYVHLPHYAPQAYLDKSINGAFGACIEMVDWSTAMIRFELERLGLLENTLIIFTSDNGSRGDHGACNAPLRGAKGSTWEGGQRVPCIWYHKGKIDAGQTCGEVMSHLDFLPTFMRLSGGAAQLPQPIDGQDVRDVLYAGKVREDAANTLAYYWMDDLEAIRVGNMKLHFAKRDTGASESVKLLYDLDADISEENNLYDAMPETVAALSKRADAFRAALGDKRSGIAGNARRPVGRVENAKPLTVYDERHPYIVAMYDTEEFG